MHLSASLENWHPSCQEAWLKFEGEVSGEKNSEDISAPGKFTYFEDFPEEVVKTNAQHPMRRPIDDMEASAAIIEESLFRTKGGMHKKADTSNDVTDVLSSSFELDSARKNEADLTAIMVLYIVYSW